MEASNQKPQSVSIIRPDFDAMPAELRALPRWICWRLERPNPNGKAAKVPYDPRAQNGRANAIDPATWGTFEQAQTAYEEGGYHGVGFVLNGDGIAGADIDNCEIDGKPDSRALKLLDDLGASYIEASPGGSGLRAFGYADRIESGTVGRYDGLHVELYSTGRYLTVTGRTFRAGPLARLNGFAELATAIRGAAPAATLPEGRQCPVGPEVLKDLRSALAAIRADDYSVWIAIGHALKVLGDAGRALWIEWSQTSDKWRPEDARRWDGFQPQNTSYQVVFSIAQRHGWVNPASVSADGGGVEIDLSDSGQGAMDLSQFSLAGRSKEMRQQMLNDVHVLGRVALQGQFTVFYAEPNCGKTLLTLWMLREAAESGKVDADRVFYINCDDSFKGLVEKTAFAEECGFHMLADGHQGFSASALAGVLASMIDEGTARGAVIILDTLKKFTDLMNKKAQTDFNQVLRGFVLAGGTVIALAHTNKYRDDSGKLVYQGTADMLQDADCMYMLDSTKREGEKLVTFERGKHRGDVAAKMTFAMDDLEGMTWAARLDSVREISGTELNAFQREIEQAKQLRADEPIIQAVLAALADGPMSRTDLVSAVLESGEGSRARIRQVINRYIGDSYLLGHRWRVTRGEHNAQFFEALPGNDFDFSGN